MIVESKRKNHLILWEMIPLDLKHLHTIKKINPHFPSNEKLPESITTHAKNLNSSIIVQLTKENYKKFLVFVKLSTISTISKSHIIKHPAIKAYTLYLKENPNMNPELIFNFHEFPSSPF